jgi:hypothetical protein
MKTITLDDKEMQILRTIVLDSDKAEALRFVVDLWDRVKEKEPQACGPKSA